MMWSGAMPGGAAQSGGGAEHIAVLSFVRMERACASVMPMRASPGVCVRVGCVVRGPPPPPPTGGGGWAVRRVAGVVLVSGGPCRWCGAGGGVGVWCCAGLMAAPIVGTGCAGSVFVRCRLGGWASPLVWCGQGPQRSCLHMSMTVRRQISIKAAGVSWGLRSNGGCGLCLCTKAYDLCMM